MRRPTSITVIGVIFIIAGFVAAWGCVYALLHHHVKLNLAVFMIPVGFGLLKSRSSSRWWAKVWIGFFSLVVGLMLGFYPFYGDRYSVTWFDEQLVGTPRHAVAVGIPIVFLIFARLIWRSLASPAAAPFFDDYELPNADQTATELPGPPVFDVQPK
ncbi:MAG: hypothetical protein J0L73_18500 [Verrucomicrobia bacterium]|nr:hypothetical protein [Verrucomicrobiota bacterium]